MFDQFVIHSEAEEANDTNAGFWSNTQGWTNLICATVFSIEEMQTLNLPVSRNSDARWIPVAHAYDPSLRTFCEITELSDEEVAASNAIEIHGVREEDDVCEVSTEAPHFFSTYVHLIEGGTQCVGDFGSYGKAKAHAETLAQRHGWPIYSFVPERFTHA